MTMCVCECLSVCFYLVLISVEKFLQKRAPFTALQNSESTAHIIKNFSIAAPLKQNCPFFQLFATMRSPVILHWVSFLVFFFLPFFPYCSCFCSILFFNYVSPLSIRARNISKTSVDNAIWNARKFWNFLAFGYSWTLLTLQAAKRQAQLCLWKEIICPIR